MKQGHRKADVSFDKISVQKLFVGDEGLAQTFHASERQSRAKYAWTGRIFNPLMVT